MIQTKPRFYTHFLKMFKAGLKLPIDFLLALRNLMLCQACLLCRLPASFELALCDSCKRYIKQPSVIPHNLLTVNNPWQTIRLFSDYQFPVDNLISEGKFNDKPLNFYLLGKLFAKKLHTENIDKDLILIPVPMHLNKLRQRGFNQALEIAKPLAKKLNLTIDTRLVKRISEGKVQHQLSQKKRYENSQNLFEVQSSVPKKVAVIDDVFTTGATMGSICNCLKKAGVENIEVWIIARTLKQG